MAAVAPKRMDNLVSNPKAINATVTKIIAPNDSQTAINIVPFLLFEIVKIKFTSD